MDEIRAFLRALLAICGFLRSHRHGFNFYLDNGAMKNHDKKIEMTKEALMQLGREKVEQYFVELFGRAHWIRLNDDEKKNYSIAYAIGFIDGMDQEKI